MNRRSYPLSLALAACAMGLLLGAPAARAAGLGTFVPVGKMKAIRHLPTLTVLADGTVLVAGGESWGASGYVPAIASTERFDPKTNQFVPDARMTAARSFHSAALLSDGRVLVLGGFNDQNRVVATAEVYDPATKAFTRVGNMSEPRAFATATPLLDGRVLVAGGYGHPDGSVVLTSAELFDPATGTFQPTGSLQESRHSHAAVRLSDGRVAILGDSSVVEIYDLKTGTFGAQGETTVGRLDSAVFLVPGNKILLAGGGSAQGILDSIETYDPVTGQAAVTGHLSAPWAGGAAVTLADGRILLAGGWTGATGATATATATAELIDPVTSQASPAATMTRTRAEGAGILLPDGRALIVGAVGRSDYLAYDLVTAQSAEVYVPDTSEGSARAR